MKLNKFGELVAETGFDGGSYEPRYASRTSVYIGDMSREDIRVKALVAKRNASAMVQNLQANAAKIVRERAKIARQDIINQSIREREAKGAAALNAAKTHGYLSALESGRTETVNPWVGSPFAGFGSGAGETRINPDSNESVEIVDMNMPEVGEYGVNNWMEDPSQIIERVDASQTGYTSGKVVMQTMVDYARTADRSVVGLAVPAQGIEDQNMEVWDAYNAKFSQAAPMGAASDNTNLIVAVAAAAAIYFLWRKHA